jgi:hypothetical protein
VDDETKIFPRFSAFEVLLSKVYLELWDRQNSDPAGFALRVEHFANTWFSWTDELILKFPDLKQKLDQLHARIKNLQTIKNDVDPFTADIIDRVIIPNEDADFAREVWRGIRKILTDKGFDYPIVRPSPGYAVSKLRGASQNE